MENVKISKIREKKKFKFEISSSAKIIIKQVFYFLFVIVMARSVIFEKFMPFSVAMIASVPYKNMISFFVGQTIGYLLPASPESSVSYISAAVAVVSMRWALNDLEHIKKSRFFAPIVTFIPLACTLFVLKTAVEFTLSATLIVIFESLLASISAYFFSKTILVVSGRRKFKLLTAKELVNCSITSLIFLVGFCAFHAFGVSLGRILFCVLILFFSFYFGLPGSLLSGLSIGAFFAVSSNLNLISAIAYAFGAVLSGFAARFRKIFVCLAFFISYIAIHIFTGNLVLVFYSILESLISSIIFLILPKNGCKQFAKLLLKPIQKATPNEIKLSVALKINFASKAVMSVAQCVGQVASKLYNINKEEVENAGFSNAIKKTCDRCNLNPLCWSEYKDETTEVFNKAKIVVKKSNFISETDFPKNFQKRCSRLREVIKGINVDKQEQIQKKSAEQRISEIEKIISSQFSSTKDVLKELSNEFIGTEKTNTTLSEEISKMIEDYGFKPDHVACSYDNDDRIFIEIEMNSEKFTKSLC